MSSYYDQDGAPMDTDAWIRAFEDREARIIGSDYLGEIHVSTVWLGLDHGFGGPPLIFETMIFGGEHDQYQDRYSTKEQAIEGHQHALALVRGKVAE